jgi:TPP-dependent indolepyruvate ferredoxin oxidoreductase alpha subunit
VDLVALCRACGVSHVEKVSTREQDRLREIFRSSLAANDLKVLVLEYPCSRCRDAVQS